MRRNLTEYLRERGLLQVCGMGDTELDQLTYEIEKTYLAEYLGGMVTEIEDVMSISPLLEWREILESGVRKIVEALGADAGTIRLFEPESGHMMSFGSYRFREKERKQRVSMTDSISGMVARSGKSYVVPNILGEPLYRDKDVATTMDLNSLIAVPLVIPAFIEAEAEIRGTLQIYYHENDRRFDPLEITHAEVLARRIGHVVARKRILDLSQLNYHKEKLVEKMFTKLSKREGIKMRELFGMMIPELNDIMLIQGCGLFSVSEDAARVRLELSHPDGLLSGESRGDMRIEDYPYMRALINGRTEFKDTETERIAPTYVLVRDPERSPLSGPGLAALMQTHNSSSMLAIPLASEGKIRFFMVFFAAERASEFTPRDIELLTFFAKEVMKALRIERLDDLLHDFKNPVVAFGGFARRLKKMLASSDPHVPREKMAEIVDVLVEEAERMEGVMRSAVLEGRERLVDPGRTLERRVRINAEAVLREHGADVNTAEAEVEGGLSVWCVPQELERAIDNLLLNAREHVSPGGKISGSCVRSGNDVIIEIRNTGAVDEHTLAELQAGRSVGRGVNIVRRFAQESRGRLEVMVEGEETLFRIILPVHR